MQPAWSPHEWYRFNPLDGFDIDADDEFGIRIQGAETCLACPLELTMAMAGRSRSM